MTTISTLIQAAIDKGYQFDAFTNVCSRFSNLNDYFPDGTDTSHFGFTKDGKVWFWFKIQNFKDYADLNGHLFFDHRYNTINGHTMKSYRQEYKAMELLGLR